MSNGGYRSGARTARDYYDSADADNVYRTIWGGEDIHVGLYDSDDEPIFDASRRTVRRMASRLKNLREDSVVLDIGSGYGGPARFLAQEYGCRVVALNQSKVQNRYARAMSREQGLEHLVEVVDANFEKIPYPNGSFDAVWSQEAILHSEERVKVLQEVARVLKPGGDFVFTDPMQADDCPEGVLRPILERLYLTTLASPGFYREQARRLGMEEVGFEDHSPQLTNHYARVLEETERRRDELLARATGADYLQRQKEGLVHWVEGGRAGYLTWGIFHFRNSGSR
jgi:sarcosine/dimethylglycine N-methyltransferase